MKDGAVSGTTGQNKRVEALSVALKNAPYSGGISYKTHVENYSWLDSVSDGAISGKPGESKRVEAIQISLTGEMNNHYDVYYRVHSQDYGWLGWAKNGMKAGTENGAKQVEAVMIKLVPKNQGEAVNENDSFKNAPIISYNNYNLTLANAVSMQMTAAPQTDLYKNSPAYVSKEHVSVYDRGYVAGSEVNLRTSPTLTDTSNIYASVKRYAEFIVLDDNIMGDSSSGSTKWWKIKYKDGTKYETLYIHSTLAGKSNSKVRLVNADSNVYAEKNASSFLYGTVKKDTELSILEDSDNWYRITYTWRNARSSDVETYLNPANFANDAVQRFQFMNLGKPTGISADVLNQYLKGKGILEGKGEAFVQAGSQFGVNEIYLMAHAILETGNGTSELANGIEYNGKKVYNMYGIGANDGVAIENGSKRAYSEGWFTPEAAIIGGAAFIGEGYLRGEYLQNTLYEMRWNPEAMEKKNKPQHQYATDIGWASKQVRTLSNVLNEVYNIKPFTLYLEIPVYQ
ncbi:hypothetical protein F9279_21335 [Bacillus sp. B1-b2]|nr:hypothetical protein F9279_21335 [Bacillus sp. B1-b2]